MKYIVNLILLAVAMAAAVSCSDSESYADLLAKEDRNVNNFLADQRVELSIPEDSVFEYGPDAPYYRLDDDGYHYMQVLNPGTEGNRATDDELIYFRYTRYGLASYVNGKLPAGAGNNISLMAYWFRYNNFRMQGSYQWGQGIQYPLKFLPVDCEVNLVIKSQVGIVDEMTDVQPYLYNLTYQRPVN